MTTERQITANRRNATQSTGPKTAEGLRRAVSNARRHGLSCPVPEEEVAARARTLADDLGITCATAAPEIVTALRRLSDAEARLQRALSAERDAFAVWGRSLDAGPAAGLQEARALRLLSAFAAEGVPSSLLLGLAPVGTDAVRTLEATGRYRAAAAKARSRALTDLLALIPGPAVRPRPHAEETPR